MKKIMFLLSMVTICASCAKEIAPDQQAPVAGPNEFIATVEDVATKTQLDANLKVLWGKEDAISVFDEAGNHFKFQSQGIGSSVVFKQVTEGELVGSTFYAIFPYNENNTIEGNVINTSMNTNNYTASPGSFSKSWHNIMTAKSNGNELKFKNLAALVKFEIPEGLELSSFYFAATNIVAQNLSLTIDESGVPSVTSRSTESYGCTVSARDGGTLTPGVYYMPVLPGTYKNFRMTLTWASGSVTQSDAFSLDAFNPERNKIINVGTLYDNREYYRWITFENAKMHSAIPWWQGQDDAQLNNFTIIENPWKYKANSSNYVVKMDASSFSSPHGGFNVNVLDVPSVVKGRIKGVTFQMFITSANAGKYYPRLELSTNNRIMPTIINGKKPSGSAWTQAEFKAATVTDGWNTFTYPVDLTSLSTIKIRPMAWFGNGTNVDSSTGDRIVYFDNIGFSYVE